MPTKAVFFDRDGTLIEDRNYLRDPDGVQLRPGAADAVRRLRAAGYRIIVVTNQSGLARGLFDAATLEAIHERMRREFAREGAAIDAIYHCPYLDGPEAVVDEYRRDSDLRKPKPGMYLLAAREHDIDLSASWSVGDSARDSQAGKAAGCRTIRLAPDGRATADAFADVVVPSLAEAVRCVLEAPDRKPAGADAAPLARSEKLLAEIAEHLRIWERRMRMEQFTGAKLGGLVAQIVALGLGLWAAFSMISPSPDRLPSHRWLAAIFVQLVALTFFVLHRGR